MKLDSMPTRTMKRIAFVALLTALCPLLAAADSKTAADPFAGAFFPPEVVMLARDRIALTPGQLEAFRDIAGKTQLRSDELRMKLERETAALSVLAKRDRVDEAAISAQLDRVLDIERELKHLHVGMLSAIKNLLTPEQQSKLREVTKDGGKQLIEATRKRLTGKVERVKQGMQNWAAGGRDPSALAKTMEEKVKPLLDTGKVLEAEAELDRLLERLAPDAK
jgi:Spy/CpxP family protein refolding chaperone